MTNPARYRQRRIKYLDYRIQFWLIAALVLLEVAITLLGTGYLYLVFDQRLEQQFYSVHRAADGLYVDLFTQVGYVLAGMTFTNLLALFVADHLWRGHVGSVTRELERGLRLTRDIDLRAHAVERDAHQILDRLASWRNSERQRMEKIWSGLAPLMNEPDYPLDRRLLRQQIQQLAQQLPVGPRPDQDSAVGS
ncbi:hypothetical protein [Sedimenticola hydrogenitrophicus]|uniref:hypothetical protein n=1 Tax=Sedimenticola hydrogenitrophicus TaxID=2967975 RepID=UPI0023B162E8|nr:hypothetical protein [Sedimenticola hydrogenitrophicus]